MAAPLLLRRLELLLTLRLLRLLPTLDPNSVWKLGRENSDVQQLG